MRCIARGLHRRVRDIGAPIVGGQPTGSLLGCHGIHQAGIGVTDLARGCHAEGAGDDVADDLLALAHFIGMGAPLGHDVLLGRARLLHDRRPGGAGDALVALLEGTPGEHLNNLARRLAFHPNAVGTGPGPQADVPAVVAVEEHPLTGERGGAVAGEGGLRSLLGQGFLPLLTLELGPILNVSRGAAVG